MQKVLHNLGNIFKMSSFLTVSARAVFRTQLKVYCGAFSALLTLLQKSPTINIRLCCLQRQKKQIKLYYLTYFYMILYDCINCSAFVDIKQTLCGKSAIE